MKISKKAFTIIPLFFIAFLFGLSLIWAEDVQACNCNNADGLDGITNADLAKITCQLNRTVADGDTVTCSARTDYTPTGCDVKNNCSTCWNCGVRCSQAVGSASCPISAGSSSCTMEGFDCTCSPVRVDDPSATHGSVSPYPTETSGCSGYGYPYHDPSYPYYWVWTQNPGTCTIKYNYTPPCTPYCSGSCTCGCSSTSCSGGTCKPGPYCSSNCTNGCSSLSCSGGVCNPSAYSLSVTKSGTGTGSVTATGCTLSWSGNIGACSADYNTSITLAAGDADTGSTWAGWSAGTGSATVCSSTSDCAFSLAQNSTVTATFPLQTKTLTVTKSGTGSGTVRATGCTLSWNDNIGACSADYNTSITLAAGDADTGSTWAGWSGDCSGAGACTLLMTANRSVTANFNTTIVYPCQEHNVSGWAWSENIGWISFSCKNQGVAGDYGVDIIASTGLFSGYAWSENIGWITFNESELTGCPCLTSPCPSCQAKLDILTKQISGWARALAYGGGWDGWIRLKDTNYGVWIDTSKSPAEFRNWAWSDMNTGWISFNCLDRSICSTSNYKVVTNLSSNLPPVANFFCTPASCSVYTNEILTLNNDSTDPDGDGDIVLTKWNILGWGLDIDKSCAGKCDYPFQGSSVGSGPHKANLYVEDAAGASNSKEHPFTVFQGASADFKCSLVENSNWQSCADFHAQFGAKVYFQDQSTASGEASISSRDWAFTNGIPATVTGNVVNPQTRFYSIGTKQVSLTVTDTASESASESYNLQIDISFPKWEEIAPF